MRRLFLAGLALLAGGASAGCNRQSGDDRLADLPSGSEGGRQEDQFGGGFGEKFRADPSSEPEQPKDDDVKPVSMTTEPVAID